MSHKRIIGIIIILCITLLFIPILKTSKTLKKTESPKIIFSEQTTDKNITEIELETTKPALTEPTSPRDINDESTIEAPAIPPLSKKPVQTDNKKTAQWFVQIASIKATNIISLMDLKLALKKAKFKTKTENITLSGKKWVRFLSLPQHNQAQALTLKYKINKALKKYHIHALVKQN